MQQGTRSETGYETVKKRKLYEMYPKEKVGRGGVGARNLVCVFAAHAHATEVCDA
jgi:hypothetical protein